MQNYSFQQGLWSVPPKRDMTRSLLLIPAEQIVPNPNQPRRIFDEEKLKELMISIAQVGLIQPLTVRQAAGGSGEDQGLELGIGAGGDELVAGLQLHGADAVLAARLPSAGNEGDPLRHRKRRGRKKRPYGPD